MRWYCPGRCNNVRTRRMKYPCPLCCGYRADLAKHPNRLVPQLEALKIRSLFS